MWKPHSRSLVSRGTEQQRQEGVPFHTHYFVFMLQCLYNLHLVQVNSVTNVYIPVITSCCDIASVSTIANASYLLCVYLLLCETLSHVKIPNTDRAI